MNKNSVKVKCESCSRAVRCCKHKNDDCKDYSPEVNSNFLASVKAYVEVYSQFDLTT